MTRDVHSRYDLHRHAEVQTGEELEQRVRRDLEQRHGGLFGRLIAAITAPGEVDDVLDAQAAQLKRQVLTRAAPPPPDVHYPAIPHARLHEGVSRGGEPGAVGEVGDIWTRLGNQLATFNDAIGKAITISEDDWVGRAGDGARRALADMGNRAGEAGTAAQLAGTLFAQQSRALSTARASTPPPPAEPFDAGAARERLMTITDPVAFARQAAADRAVFEQQREDHEAAARAVETYDRTVAQTAAAQPAFAPPLEAPPQPGPPQPDPPRPDPPRPGPPRAENPLVPIGSGGRERGAVPPPAVGDGQGDGTGGSTGTSGVVSPNEPPVSGITSPSGSGGGSAGGAGSAGGGGNVGNPGQGGPGAGGLAGVPGSGGGGGRPGGGGSGGGAGFGGRVPGGGAGSGFGPGSGARGVAGGGAAGLLPHGGDAPAGRAGGTAGGTGGGGAGGGARGAGGVGGVGAGVAGGVGAGKGAGDEDVERSAPSYLLEPDPDGIFGNDQVVAPPTIGG
ncbi:hypothetical protein [Saccharothrix sp. Mg75]|uniref:hypothetical protein n=1 Tax=Saccharothrix sp. Mg75 TaxID=3445357 RepID=UPI003EEBC5B5